MKPRARSVYFSMFIWVFPQPTAPPLKARKPHLHWVSAGRVDTSQPTAVVTDGPAGLRQMWEQDLQNGRGNFTNSCVRAPRALSSVGASPAAPERPLLRLARRHDVGVDPAARDRGFGDPMSIIAGD